MSLVCLRCNTSNADEARFCQDRGVNIAEELKKRYKKKDEEQQNIKQEEPKIDDVTKNHNFGFFIAIFLVAIGAIGALAFDSNSNATHQLPEQKNKEYEAPKKTYKVNELYHRDGILYEVGTNIKANGIGKGYYESGTLMGEGNFKDGKKNGISKSYYESGVLSGEGNYKDGKKNGIGKTYYESGVLRAEWNYKDGKSSGISKIYYESGALAYEGNYKDDKLNGISKGYYESGALKYKGNFKDDKVISEERY